MVIDTGCKIVDVMLKYIVATLLIVPTVIGGSYALLGQNFLATAQDTTPPPTPKWYRIEYTPDAGFECASHGEKALLVTIDDWQFNFVEARCYPRGDVN